jgi:hypothetical protein
LTGEMERVKGIEPSYSAWKSANFRNVFKNRSDILQPSGRLRSLQNFSLSEWQQYWLWGPSRYDDSLINYAGSNVERWRSLRGSVEVVGSFGGLYVMPYESNRPTFICRSPHLEIATSGAAQSRHMPVVEDRHV